MLGILLTIFIFAAILSPSGRKRKSAQQYRMQKIARQNEKRLQRDAQPARLKMNAARMEARIARERNRDRRGVAWALVAGGLASQTEADGATILALRRDASLSQDPERLHAAALQVLRAATNES